ncbi:sodium hydrogen exchanger family protein [Venturia nashicola]|uniref:Sodium hydrogen exchanger family protein n=1 Tax=Venturia nashicola TaxID=86259 RepID=A0A4Z1NSF3_9PEZI|nr:sodium hydrogen exchanger family protein [Venturia nashicola]TLD23620.1 sodium hydrogen exchanger family protein [Venturia nashicola]
MSISSASLPYHEPDILTILIQASFLLVLNAVNHVLDNLLYCGLVGQLLIGIAWGTPGAKWLPNEVETVIVQLGYLGLVLLVYEGGLSTSFPSLKANILLSIFVALTGICLPIALSFTLQGLAGASPLQAFAAGAALCSTSLGTTFTILGTTGLTDTRLGVVLTSAAMLDDVVGLVMVQIISNFSASGSGFNSTTVVRPVFVSLGFAIICPLTCWMIVSPITSMMNKYREENTESWVQRLIVREQTAFVLHTLLLIAMVTASSYAGTSNLFAAYLSGAMVSWWDSEVPHPSPRSKDKHIDHSARRDDVKAGGLEPSVLATDSKTKTQNTMDASTVPSAYTTSGTAVFRAYYAQPTEKILKPFFFASIGFSIPISKMFTGTVVWRGIIYTLLMIFGKLACGLWLICFAIPTPKAIHPHRLSHYLPSTSHFWGRKTPVCPLTDQAFARAIELQNRMSDTKEQTRETPNPAVTDVSDQAQDKSPVTDATSPTTSPPSHHLSTNPSKPLSLYPASILGFAMVSRGEIGFLISSLADSNGIFSTGGNDDIFLIVTWAIVLCTIVGPISVGLLVKRLKRLEMAKEQGGGGRDVLGVWGVR